MEKFTARLNVNRNPMIKILVVGQTPPPFHGQAVMIEETLKANYEGIRFYHVRMGYSKTVDEIGRFQFRKILHLFWIIMEVIYHKFRHNIKILYYPPAGPDKVPVYRDLIFLNSTRFLFKHTIFHFRAAGVSTIYERLSPLMKSLYRRAYFFPDISIRLSELNPPDGSFFKAKKEHIVPNGMKDHSLHFVQERRANKSACQLLYVGIVREAKGMMVLIEACRVLKTRGLKFCLKVVGRFDSPAFRNTVMEKVKGLDLKDEIQFSGVLIGEEKYRCFNRADIYCYPTFYGPESFGLSLLEAMQFSLPVVATEWRGVPSVIRDEVNGFLVPIKDSAALADKLERLIKNPQLRKAMGTRGREIYLEQFGIEKYHDRMEKIFLSLENDG
jgi:glycosyltransferase involved in cell wall biosynthesis